MPFPFDDQRIQRIREQVAQACDRAGDQPWLVGYDANERRVARHVFLDAPGGDTER